MNTMTARATYSSARPNHSGGLRESPLAGKVPKSIRFSSSGSAPASAAPLLNVSVLFMFRARSLMAPHCSEGFEVSDTPAAYTRFSIVDVMLNVTIIIPAWNEAERIRDCLLNATRQTIMPHEVLVVDNRSTDNTCAIVEQFIAEHPEAPVKLLHQNDEQGLFPPATLA